MLAILLSFRVFCRLCLILRLSSRQTRRHWRVFAPNFEPKMQIRDIELLESESWFLAHFPLQNLLLSIELVGARPTRSKYTYIYPENDALQIFGISSELGISLRPLCSTVSAPKRIWFPQQNLSSPSALQIYSRRFWTIVWGVVSLTYKTEFIFIRIHIWWWNLGRGNLIRKNTGQESLSNEAYATSVFKQMNQAKIFSEGLAFQPQCSSEKDAHNFATKKHPVGSLKMSHFKGAFQTNERNWNKAGMTYGR